MLLPALIVSPAMGANAADPTPWRSGDPTFTAPTRKPPVVGVNYHGLWADYSDSVRAGVLDKLASAGVTYVRLDVAWSMLQPDGPNSYDMAYWVPEIDRRIAEITSRGMKVLMMLYWAPKWSSGTSNKNGVPRDPVEYGKAAAWAAQRWRGKVGAIELWNEPDLADFLANRSVATYTSLIKAAYPRIKAVAPETIVVTGAPTAVKTDWYREFYRLGGADFYDAIGIHPYMGLIDAPPSTCVQEYIQFYPCNIPNLISLMKANGDGDKEIWATEYGWSAHDNSMYGSPTPEWKRGVTAQQQADYLVAMHQYLGQWPQVEAAFWYNDRNRATGDAHQDNFGLLKRDLTSKPAYFAMKCAAAGICGPATASSSYLKSGATWRVNDSGSDLGTAWRAVGYNDGAWRSGPSQLGYGDGDERTVLKWGTDPASKPITSYARTTFNAGTSITDVKAITLRALVDDGAVVYLNGQEVWRFNLPAGAVTAATRASRFVAAPEESQWRTATLPVAALRAGTNTVAVEIHNDAPSSSDLSLDLELSPQR